MQKARGPSWGVQSLSHWKVRKNLSPAGPALNHQVRKSYLRRRNHLLSLAPNQYISSRLTRYKYKITLLEAYVKIGPGCSFKNDRKLQEHSFRIKTAHIFFFFWSGKLWFWITLIHKIMSYNELGNSDTGFYFIIKYKSIFV